MIGRLTGRLGVRGPERVLIDVGGVGYVVHVSERTLAELPEAGETVSLHTDLLVREDLLQLFGFATLQEKECHRLLMTVQGIGAKASLAILGALGPEGVGRAIALGDPAAIRAAPGVGPKLAQRVVNELKDKAPAAMAIWDGAAETPAEAPSDPAASGGPTEDAPAARPRSATRTEALSALANLGYGTGEAASAVAAASAEMPEADTAELSRAALKRLAPS